jgi:tetratricopeptide (TPR) repeat protein
MSSALEAQETAARTFEQQREWAKAAGAWASIAEALGRGGDPDRAARAWDAAGEAFRRDDRPALADKALKTALLLTEDVALATVVRVKRSGCLAAQGQLADARQVLMQAMLGPSHAQTVVADGQVDLALATGDVSGAQKWASRITGDDPLVSATRAFRQAQCARLMGDMNAAQTLLDQAAAELPGLSGQAAVAGERAEMFELMGDSSAAMTARHKAISLHEQERRNGPKWLALAALLRMAAMMQVSLARVPVLGAEGDAIAAVRGMRSRAKDRNLVLTGIDLDLAVALSERDGVAHLAAIDAATACGATYRAGRARVLGVQAGLLAQDQLQTAEKELAGVPVWWHQAKAWSGDAASTQWLTDRGLNAPG